MSLQSTYHLQNSLPNRSAAQRPRSLSLSEYQTLTFDREALQAAYQQSIGLPTSSSTSAKSNFAWSEGHTGPSSTETHDTSVSTLSGHLKAGDNSHDPRDFPSPPPRSEGGNLAGVGAGHSLTPPQSPFHHAGQFQQQKQALSPPPPPPRPGLGKQRASSGVGQMRRGLSDMGVQDGNGAAGWSNESEYAMGNAGDGRPVGKRRALPPVPTNVPEPVPPAWQPDYKPHIPADLTAPSAQNAYAQLSAPPPNLPPRRTRPLRQASSHSPPSRHYHPLASASEPMSLSRAAAARGTGLGPDGDMYIQSDNAEAGPSGSNPGPSTFAAMPSSASTASLPVPPEGAPDYPPGHSPTASQPGPVRRRPEAEKEVFLKSEGSTPIWSTHILDPSLRQALIPVSVHQQVSNVANVALSALSSGPKTRYDQTIGAPIDGVAKAAKEWIVRPDARFISENGGIEVGVGVVDSGMVEGWGREKGRKRARVEVISKGGGVKADVVEIDPHRQIDLKIETKSGDVLVLLPENYYGPLHITSPAHPPIFLPSLGPNLSPPANPYSAFYTAHLTPPSLALAPSNTDPASPANVNGKRPLKRGSTEHSVATKIERYVPASMREDNELINQFVGGYASHIRGEMSKVSVTSTKGKVVIGYREVWTEGMRGERVEDWRGTGVRVGVQEGKGKRRRWWRG